MSTSASTNVSSRAVLALYRSLLRVGREWPQDKIRPERSLRDVILQRTSDMFRNRRDVTDKALIGEYLAEGRREYSALTTLRDDVLTRKYPRPISEKDREKHRTAKAFLTQSEDLLPKNRSLLQRARDFFGGA